MLVVHPTLSTHSCSATLPRSKQGSTPGGVFCFLTLVVMVLLLTSAEPEGAQAEPKEARAELEGA